MLRSSVSVAALFISACMGEGSGELAGTASSRQPATETPSQLDYLVLASLADSQTPLSMAGYQLSP